MDKVEKWMEFGCAISEVPYDDDLAQRFGDETLILTDAVAMAAIYKEEMTTIPAIVSEEEREVSPCLLFMSDLHYGETDHNFLIPPNMPSLGGPQISLVEALKKDFERIGVNAGVLIAAGDFTSRAKWEPSFRDKVVEQIKEIISSLRLYSENLVVCPGNHDVARTGSGSDIAVQNATRYEHEEQFRLFRMELTGREHKAPLSACFTFPSGGFSIVVGVLNSANLAPTNFNEYGYVGTDPLNFVMRQMAVAKGPNIKIIVLHHHLLPINSIELPGKGGISLTIDANEILRRAQEAGVQLILHGHQHIPKIIKTSQLLLRDGNYTGLEDNLFIISAGSAGSKEIPPGTLNTYTVIRIEKEGLYVCFRQLSNTGEEVQQLLEARLPIWPK